MLKGQELGAALRQAIELKGVTKVDVARHFGVKPPSVQDWLKRGVIAKDKLPALWAYFSDVVGPDHWGLDPYVLGSPSSAWPPQGRSTEPITITLPASLDTITAAITALSPPDREQLAKALAILAVAPDSAEAKARVLAALGAPASSQPSITASVLAATDLVETPVKATHRD